MSTTHTRNKFVTATVGAAIAAVTAPALLFLGAGTAQAIQDVNESAPGITVGAFNPQPDTPGVDDPGIRPPSISDSGIKVGIIDPGLKVGIIDPGLKVGIGGPDTRPAR